MHELTNHLLKISLFHLLIHFMLLRSSLSFTYRAPSLKRLIGRPCVQVSRSLSAINGDLNNVDASVIHKVSHLSLESKSSVLFGDFERIMSQGKSGRIFSDVTSLELSEREGDFKWVRGRVQTIRSTASACFIVLRQGSFNTIQVVYFKDKSSPEALESSQKMLKWLGSLTPESLIDIEGEVAAAKVKSCSITNVEIALKKCFVVSRANILPFQLEDAARSEVDIVASQNTARPFPRLGQDLRLNNRYLDLRVPSNNAIMRIQSAVCQLFRESLYKEGFVEIHSPKIVPGESEGGSDVFRTDYFGTPACLAQSPQLYKQMAISSDLGRVFEVGPVFRAEKSRSSRHLCEFTGLDLEMNINEHYDEVLGVSHRMFKHIFEGLESRFKTELETVRSQYFSEPLKFTEEPCIIHWEEGISMLRKAGIGSEELGDFDDLNTAQELLLGKLVLAEYGTDFFIMDRYPSSIRPFYTMPCHDDARYSNSYDMFIRGQEICSGAQRNHDPELLRRVLETRNIDPTPLDAYVKSFEYGVNPHGGAGIGLERVVFLYLGLDNVRKASMFPRDTSRCSP